MTTFRYKAIQTDGAVAEGNLEARNRQDAFLQMEGKGWTALRLEEAPHYSAPQKDTFRFPWGARRIPFRMLEDFTRSLSSLLAAGVPLSRALTILYKETGHKAASAKWREVHDQVIDGVSLADAMAKSPEVFPRVYVAMVESGETGGFLDVVLGQIADFQAQEKELRAKVLSALIYPAVLMVLASAVLIFLLVFFIPRFQTLFEGFDAALPLLTRVIVGTSRFLRRYGPYLLAGGVVLAALARNWLRSDGGQRAWERLVLRLPLVGPLLAKRAMSRFCRMLGTLLAAGVPLMNGLGVARRSLGYRTLIDLVANASERVKKGEPLAASLAGSRILFSGSTLEMIAVAEESGRLDQELIRLAGVAEGALDRQLKTAVALAEPMLLFLMAGFIGTIFVGMVLPIFTIQEYIK
ncbi:MAG: type II secretion system F family protein [Kiritimatiellae bacterium]|nr:type II secretion system F family protein [Kiritimatiellia bacterium]